MFNIRIEGVEAGRSIYIPVDGRIYTDDGKLLSSLTIEYATFSSAGALATSAIVVDYVERYSSELSHVLNIRARAFLEPVAIKYIEERRRVNKYHRVELKLELRFLRFHSSVYHYNYVYVIGRASPSILRLPNDAVMLKAGEPLLFIDNFVYSELETRVVIDGPRWVKEFLPAFGLGSYTILELPLPDTSKLPRDSLDHFIAAIKSLQSAKEAVYQTLSIGPPLTALRNALLHFCDALKALGLAIKEDGGCRLDENKLIELFKGNKWLAKLVVEVFTNAKRIATRGPETTQPHLAPEPAPTLYHVESLIGLVAYMFKIVLDSIIYSKQQ